MKRKQPTGLKVATLERLVRRLMAEVERLKSRISRLEDIEDGHYW
jgi:chaperonin cofactor prefoldin